ncbi:hypothetical protein EB118_22130 [bacterium]|nr:hypothetical protein [bacterium]NDC96014.1 hypothetical protein [bacterium]NDD85632.1 hypothetical protein [bacterium]NDG32755.1 hypothetical protein [bacterium]
MAKKTAQTEDKAPIEDNKDSVKPSIHSLEWTDYVLRLLSDDEKIKGNPTTDGLRRVFEIALNCRIISSTTNVVQSPSPDNEKRATVIHSLTYHLNPETPDPTGLNLLTVDGSADVYWGNCDKVYRNHPVAVAETRAEGRALRRALRLRKVVAAEELAENIEDNVDGESVGKITSNQINFISVLGQRLNVNILKILQLLDLGTDNIYNIKYDDALVIIKKLSEYQQDQSTVSSDLVGYDESWKNRS